MISKELQLKIQASLLLKPEVKEAIIKNWDTISQEDRESIIELLKNSFDLQDMFLSSAIDKDDNLVYGIKKRMQNQKIKMILENEKKEQEELKKKIILDF